MDFWIRSQDRKELIPQPTLYAIYSENEKCAYIGNSMTGHIGKYKTLERALEILDEIQVYIRNNIARRNSESGFNDYFGCTVYEMPKE